MKRILFLLALILFLLPGLCLAEELTRETQTLLLKARDTVTHAERELVKKRSISADFKTLKALVEELRVNHLLLQDRFQTRQQTVNTLGPKAIDRHTEMLREYNQVIEQLLTILDAAATEKALTSDTLKKLRTLLENIAPKRSNPIYGNLPYRYLNYGYNIIISGTTVLPAYLGGDQTVKEEDLASTPLAPISKTIAEKARELQWNPVLIYEWVKNNVESEWYWGVQKGAEETLRQKSGNDADQACLLIALLRASGYPCRYVKGIIQFFPDITTAKKLIGIPDEAYLMHFIRKTSIPARVLIAGGKISNFQIEHIWVEAQIPYANYRGAVIDTHGKTWLGLDTHIKNTGYKVKVAKPWPEAMNIENIRDQYLAQNQSQDPIGYLQNYINTWLNLNQPGTTYQDLLETRTLIPEHSGILPASMQFQEIAVTHEFFDLPDWLTHKVRFNAHDVNNTLFFDITLPTWRLSNQKVVLTYEPETIEDQEIINSYGGLGNTPAYLVRLRPILKVNEERIAVGQTGLPMSSEYTLEMTLMTPFIVSERFSNTQITGNLAVIGIVSQQAIVPQEIPPEEQDAVYLLHKEAMTYIKRWNQAEEELSALVGYTIHRPIPAVVTLGGVIKVDYLLDQPHEFTFKGIYMDADLRAIELSPNRFLGMGHRFFMQLSALQGSVLENKVIEEDFGVECISTAKLFQTINQQTPNQKPVTLDTTNIATVLPTLSLPQNVKDDIANQVNQGFTVRVPQSELTYEDWTGTGYFIERPQTGEAGYMLSGMIAGGMTVWNGEKWPEDYWEKVQCEFFDFIPNLKPEDAYAIYKINSSNLQHGIVGQELDDPLEVMVRDKDNQPVWGADVTFTVTSGKGEFTGKGDISDDKKSVTVTTNIRGIAKAHLILGKKTSDNPCFFNTQDGPFQEQVGMNLVDARLMQGTQFNLQSPFTAYGFADVPFKIEKLRGDNGSGSVYDYGGFLSVIVMDQYDNPVSNRKVTFTAEPTGPNSCAQDNETRRTLLFVEPGNPCLVDIPTYQSCSVKTETLEVPTSHVGCTAPFFYGTIPNATYMARAKCAGLADAIFNLRTYQFGNCDGISPPALSMMLGFVYPTDSRGNNINAVKAGASVPVKARMSFLKEGIELKDVVMPCGGGVLGPQTHLCQDAIIGNKKYAEFLDYENGSVTFDGQSGNAQGNGIYQGTYLAKSGSNDLQIEGKATANRNWTECDKGECTNKINEPITRTKLWTLKGWLYGVNIVTNQKVIALVDKDDLAINDVSIQYTIEPAEYKAAGAYVIINKGNEPIVYLPGNLQGTDTVTLTRGFQFFKDEEYTAQVILNYGTGSEIRSEKIKIELINIHIQKTDPEFPNSKLKPFDYYPTLGSKRIVIVGPLEGKIKAKVLTPASGDTVTIDPVEMDFNQDGEAIFYLNAPALTPTDQEKIEVQFTYEKNSMEQGSIRGEWKLRNNSNVTLAEVLRGEAVFAFDLKTGENHQGKTTGKRDEERGLDFVQKMLNHIIVPLRRPVQEDNQENTISVDGDYGPQTTQTVKALIKGGTHTIGGKSITIADGIKINRKDDKPNAPKHFLKLVKDYSGMEDIDEHIGKVIDQELLVGLTKSDNDKNPKTDEDIGILEAYVCEDWDGDGISNYVEVENSADHNLDPLAKNIIDSYPQGTHGDGRLFNGLRLPNDGKGFFHYYGSNKANEDNYFVAETLENLIKISKTWSERHPDLAPLMINVFTGKNGNQNWDTNDDDKDGVLDPHANAEETETRFGYGDCGLKNGGPMCWIESGATVCHGSHENGLDVDVLYIRNDNKEAGVNLFVTDSLKPDYKGFFDKKLSKEAMNLFIDNGAIRVFTVAESGVSNNEKIQYITGHHHHFHAAFSNPNPPTGNIEINVNNIGSGVTEYNINGVSECTIIAGPVKDKKGKKIFKGFIIDAKSSNNNTKIEYNNKTANSLKIPLEAAGIITFKLKKGQQAGNVKTKIEIYTENVYEQGRAYGAVTINFQ